MNDIYKEIPGNFYDSSLKSMNPFTKYYHSNRYNKVESFLKSVYKERMKVVDLGSGACLWNKSKIPVIGVDISENLLSFGKENGYLSEFILHDLEGKSLPFDKNSLDIIVMSEVLEHIHDPKKMLLEINRVTKPNGFLILTVPYDTSISAWRYLFAMQCFLKGTIFRDTYYKHKCGHVQCFSPKSLSMLCSEAGFTVKSKKLTFLNIALLLQKE